MTGVKAHCHEPFEERVQALLAIANGKATWEATQDASALAKGSNL
jgi:hypothetical protein